ncbi:MAG TPA: hypothetical protein VFY64_07320 [Nitrososphaeraceae archaeon]|nr:hypothetical protein [Nitrososphaeraceae archaeon]
MNKTISVTFAITAVLILAEVVGITIINQWAQVEAAYQIEEIKNECPRTLLTPGESFYGLLIPASYDIEEVLKCCKKKC